MKIIGFAGSNSKKSINKQLVKYTLSQITSAETEELDITDYPLPIYGIDLEKESGIPQAVHDCIDNVQTADGLVISLAEHNGSYTVAVKNLLDWCSRCETGFFKNMPDRKSTRLNSSHVRISYVVFCLKKKKKLKLLVQYYTRAFAIMHDSQHRFTLHTLAQP